MTWQDGGHMLVTSVLILWRLFLGQVFTSDNFTDACEADQKRTCIVLRVCQGMKQRNQNRTDGRAKRIIGCTRLNLAS